jgi:hypothetical protein
MLGSAWCGKEMKVKANNRQLNRLKFKSEVSKYMR